MHGYNAHMMHVSMYVCIGLRCLSNCVEEDTADIFSFQIPVVSKTIGK